MTLVSHRLASRAVRGARRSAGVRFRPGEVTGVRGARRSAAVRFRPDGVTGVRAVVVLVCLAVFVVPLAAIAIVGADPAAVPILRDGGVVEATVNSFVSGGLSAALAVLVGGLLALLLDRTDLPGRRVLRLFLLSPLLVPPFVGAIAWVGVLGPASPLNRAWTDLTGAPLWNVYGGDGVTFLLTVHAYPVAYLVIGAALRRVPDDLVQAARVAGAGPLRALRSIVLPLLGPAALAAFVLIAVSNLADFGIPSIIGLPERFTTLSTLVYRYIQSGTVPDPLAVVSAVGIVLLVLAVVALAVSHAVRPTGHGLEASGPAPGPTALGPARVPVAVVAWTLGLALTVLPLLALTQQALLRAPGLPLTWANLSLDGLRRALTAPSTLTGIQYSLLLSLGAGLACAVLGLLVGTLVTRTRSRTNGLLAGIVMLPQAIPGLVLAVGWLLVAPFVGLFNTPWLILAAYVTAFTGTVVQSVTAPLASTSTVLEEAARAAGASRLRSLVDVSLRLALPAATTGAVLVVLTAVRELTISVLLVAPGKRTLGVAIFNLQQSGAWGAASALSLLVTLVGLAGLGLAAPRRRAPHAARPML